jgi:putative ABC transport system permease protein
METFFQDLRFAFRLFARNPWFAALAVGALALGIGANTAVFSAVNAVLIRPLPFPNPDALVAVYDTQPFCPTCPASFPKYVDWRDQNAVFDAIGGSSPGSSILTGNGNPERIRTARVTASLFRVFQLRPVAGRWISEDEDKPGGAPVAVLSYGFWQERFSGDPNVAGQTMTIDGITRTIVGVMPPEFTLQRWPAQVWFPLAMAVDQTRRGNHFMPVVARLKPGVSVATAQREMIALGARLARQYPTNHGIDVASYRNVVVGNSIGRSLLVLLGSVAFVLLIACANVANLLLARAASRRREITIRTALGAARIRLARQLLTESMLLALAGGALGVLLAFWGVRTFVSSAPANFPRVASIGVDAGVLAFTLTISMLTGVVFGLAPALHALHQNPGDALKQDEVRSGGGRTVRRASSTLVVLEIALSLVLLIGAGLMVKSLLKLEHQDAGFTIERLLTFELTLPKARYPDDARVTAFFTAAEARIKAMPGAQRVGAINMLPLVNWGSNSTFTIEGRTWLDDRSPLLENRVVRGAYFEAMGVRLVRGRLFTERDNAGAPKVLIVNDTVARRFFPNEEAVGKRITFYGSGGPLSEIVGVVASVRSAELSSQPLIEAYAPDAQYPASSMTFVVRTTAEPTALTAAIRQEIASIDPLQPLSAVRTMEDVVRTSTAEPRLLSTLTVLFATIAALLAAVGTYGIMAYSVSQRTREIGIRMAMGADRSAVVRGVLGHGVKLIAAGVTIGVLGAIALTSVLTSMLYEVSPTDPAVFAATCAGVIVVALAACYMPARSATSVDPVVVLRAL